MTVTPNIPAAAPTADTAAASRAATRAMPAGMHDMFASLLGEETGAAQQTDDNTASAISTALDRTLRKQLNTLLGKNGKPAVAVDEDGKPAGDATNKIAIDIRQDVLARLKGRIGPKLETSPDDKPATGEPVIDDTEPTPHPRTKEGKNTKPLPAVALAIALMQQVAAKPTGTGKTIQPVTPRIGQDAAEKPGAKPDGKPEDAGDPLKALTTAAADAKHQAAPTQSMAAKALPVAFGAADARDGAGQQQSGDKHQQQQRGAQQADAANAVDALKPTAAAQATAPASAPQAQHAQAQPAPSAADALAAVTPSQTAHSSAHPVAASLHIAPQTDAAPMPNLGSLAVNIAAKSKDGQKHFDIRLDPAELGRVDVKLSIDDAGKTQATLTAEKPQTLELLQRDRTTLERALRDAGLDLAGGGLSFSLKGQDREQREGTPRGRGMSVTAVAQTDSSMPLPGARLSAADSRLDIRV